MLSHIIPIQFWDSASVTDPLSQGPPTGPSPYFQDALRRWKEPHPGSWYEKAAASVRLPSTPCLPLHTRESFSSGG